MHIAKLESANERQHRPSQVGIGQVTSTKNRKHHPNPIHMIHGVCPSRGKHPRRVKVGNIFLEICTLSKRRQPTTSDIIQAT